MTGYVWSLDALDEAAVGRLAEIVALKLRRGDAVLLRGDLGAGKTTFARALIRGLLGDEQAEVPSPTFPVLQPYETARLKLSHFDLYRISSAAELDEIGFDDALDQGAALIEWPERAEEAMPDARLEITLGQGTTAELRNVSLGATGGWIERLGRLEKIHAFLAPWQPSRIAYLQGDASARAYARIVADGRSYVLMDAPRMPDGPPILNGLPYSRIAHLAEDVRPFVAIGRALEAQGASVPHIHATDLEAGLLLLEDLGDLTFAKALEAGVPQAKLWSGAVDALIELRRKPLPLDLALPDGTSYRLPRFDRAALEIELSLILDWYWPEVKGAPAPDTIRREFLGLWSPVLDRILAEPPGLFLRDVHSPNLFWLPEREPARRIGIIDFQDALAESWPLDLVSLLQDARTDVARELETRELERYLTTVAGFEPSLDAARFRAIYAAFGAQRNTRLVGLWVRLLRRDGKPGYLNHMPRTWDYLARNLAHPTLAGLQAWYGEHFADDVRRAAIAP